MRKAGIALDENGAETVRTAILSTFSGVVLARTSDEVLDRFRVTTVEEEASARAQAFDLPGAVERVRDPAAGGSELTTVAALYLAGLSAAFEAYKQGGSQESLAPVREAIGALEKISGQRPGAPEVARLVLIAAAAAAQSEREEMGAFLTHAISMESLQFAAGEPGAPVLSAHEVAGELWLQVHRFEDARAAFERARAQVGSTPRIATGLAHAATR